VILTLNIRLLLACLTALVLSIIPIPNFLSNFRPSWILLLALYCQFYLPNFFSLVAVVFLGACLDVLLSTTLGMHSLALVITTWIASSRVQRFHIFPLSQQMVLLALLCLIYQVVLYLVESHQGFHATLLNMLGGMIMSLLAWPWVQLLLSRYLAASIQNNDKLTKSVFL
jgi:rod shape-determining protein MreD